MQDVISRTSESGNPNSPLNMIVDERREFELKLGKAVDTLKKDYPDMLTEAPGKSASSRKSHFCYDNLLSHIMYSIIITM